MAQENWTSLTEIMARGSKRTEILESLFNFLRQRAGEIDEQTAFAILQSIQSPEHRAKLPLQDFAHDLHRSAIHKANGDDSLTAPELPESLADVQLSVNLPGMSAEDTIMYLIIEWARQVTGHTYAISDGSDTKPRAVIAPAPTPAPTPVPRVEAARNTPRKIELTPEEALQTLQSEFPEIAAFLMNEEYQHEDGRRLIPKKLLVQLTKGTDSTDANVRLNQFFDQAEFPAYDYSHMPQDVQPFIDRRMRFYTVAASLEILKRIVKNRQLRTNYTEAHRPAKKKDDDTQPDLTERQLVPPNVRQHPEITPFVRNEAKSPFGTHSLPRMSGNSGGMGSIDRNDHVIEPVRNEIATIMKTQSFLFGPHNERMKAILQGLTIMNPDRRFYVPVFSIHTEILGGFLTKLFDSSFQSKMIHSTKIGPAATQPGNYFSLEDALRYIHQGYTTNGVGLKFAR